MLEQRKKANTVSTYTIAGDIITFAVEGVGTFDFNAATAAHPTDARNHGYVQKIKDCGAIGRDPETGASATPEEKFAAMKECAERLMAGGSWNAVATGAGSAGGLLYRAMRNLYPSAWSDKTSFQTYIVQKAISESTRLGKKVTENDVRAGLMAVKKIAKEIDRIRAEEGKRVEVDAAGMLQELE